MPRHRSVFCRELSENKTQKTNSHYDCDFKGNGRGEYSWIYPTSITTHTAIYHTSSTVANASFQVGGPSLGATIDEATGTTEAKVTIRETRVKKTQGNVDFQQKKTTLNE